MIDEAMRLERRHNPDQCINLKKAIGRRERRDRREKARTWSLNQTRQTGEVFRTYQYLIFIVFFVTSCAQLSFLGSTCILAAPFL